MLLSALRLGQFSICDLVPLQKKHISLNMSQLLNPIDHRHDLHLRYNFGEFRLHVEQIRVVY